MVNLVVETGTGSPLSNTYVTLDEVKDYAESRVGTLKGTDDELSRQIVLAADYMEQITRFKGKKQKLDQALQFPRKGLVDSEGNSLDGTIPRAVKLAQCQLVVDSATSGKPLSNNTPTFALKRRTLGPLTQEWATGSGQVQAPVDPHAMFWSYLNDYLRGGNTSGRVIR